MENIVILTALAAIVAMPYMIIKEVKNTVVRRRFKLDVPVKVRVNREMMNDSYSSLSESEKNVLDYTKYPESETYITRTIKNVLIITINIAGTQKEITVFEDKTPSSDKWIKYLEKGYFKKR